MDSIITQFKGIPTTCISDAMQSHNNLDFSIKPVKETYRLAGRALTVKLSVGDNLAVLKAIREARSGDVLVVDAKGDTYRAIAGDFVVGMAKIIGIGGIVVDGVIRDIAGIKHLDLPVFCRGTTVAASGKAGGGEVNVPISCGGAIIHSGDIVVGDIDGVVVIPQNDEEEILRKSLAKLQKDEERAERVLKSSDEVRKYIDQLLK